MLVFVPQTQKKASDSEEKLIFIWMTRLENLENNLVLETHESQRCAVSSPSCLNMKDTEVQPGTSQS